MQTYDQLKGAIGKHAYYRAERFEALDLFPRSVAEVEIGEIGEEVLILSDVSMTGLGVLAPSESQWESQIGKELPVRLRLDDEILIEGRAKVCRADREPAGVKLGLGLTSGFLDIPEIFARRDKALFYREIDNNLSYDINMVDPAYRQFAADVLHTLRRYQSILKRSETRGNEHTQPRKADAAGVLAALEEHLIPEWRALWRRGNELVVSILDDPARLRATKHFTENVLTPEFALGPIWRRSYEKPMGYPGDFEIMNKVYSWQSEGDTPYGQLIHRIGLEVAECIATRMSMAQDMIAQLVSTPSADGSPARITNVGSGPAQEIVNYLGIKSLPRPVEVTLVDQEREALDHAYHQIIPQAVRHENKVTANCLHLSFVDLVKKTQAFDRLEPQDLIYSLGLVDYLSMKRARTLVRTLFNRLAPGGRLVIGHMRSTPLSNFWPMEFICDWTVHYRDEAEMREMARGLPGCSVTLETDPTGRVYMLSLHRD